MEHIRNIEIKNFKSIRDQRIEGCRRVNVFIGYPNVGKSNILEALGLYSALLLKYQHFKFNEICRIRHFSELFFNQDSRSSSRTIVNGEVEAELLINEFNDLEVRIADLLNKDVAGQNRNIFSATVNSGDYNFNVHNNQRTSNDSFGTVKKYEFQKDIFFNTQKPRWLAVPNGNNLLDVLMTNFDLRQNIVEIFKQYGLKLNIDRVDKSIKFQKEISEGVVVSIPYHQVADTLQRLIFYKAAIQTNSNSFLLFEEPEAHMFPPYIRRLTSDIIFDKNDNQYFIATHSPYVLDTLIEEAGDDLSVYLVDYKNGETKIKYLTSENLKEIRDFGVDLFFNIESYLKDGQVNNA